MMLVMFEEAAMLFFMNRHVYMRSVKLYRIACVNRRLKRTEGCCRENLCTCPLVDVCLPRSPSF